MQNAKAANTQSPTTPAPAKPPPAASPPATNPPAATAPDAEAARREKARAAYGAGKEAYAAGQYAAAAAHFEQADALIPAIQAKYWKAMSLDQLGDVPTALAAFEVVLASPDRQALGPELLANAEARQRALATTPAVLNVTTTPPGAHVRVSGVDLVAPTPLTLRLGPGRHLIQVSLDGYQPQQLEIVASPGAKLAPAFTLVPTGTGAAGPTLTAPPIAPLPEPSSAERSHVPGYVTLGLAGASAVVGTIFGVKALSDKEDFDEAPTTAGADDVERNALIADMAFGVALTLGITGVVLLVADDPLPEQTAAARSLDQASLRVLPYLSPTGGGASASLTF